MHYFSSLDYPDFEDKKSNKDFEFFACSIRDTGPEMNGRAIRPNGRKDYQILVIEKGFGFFKFKQNSKRVKISANNIIVFCPGDYQDYWFEGENSTISYWIHFSGTKVADLFADCNINLNLRPVYSIKRASKLRHYFEQLVLLSKQENSSKSLLQDSLAISLIYEIGRNLCDSQNLSKDYKIRPALDHMMLYPEQHQSVVFYAELCKLSVSRFSAIFKESTNMSVKEYISMIRLERIINDFYNDENCMFSIDEIAKNNGYNNMTYFYNVFRKYTGKTPGQFRKDIIKPAHEQE